MASKAKAPTLRITGGQWRNRRLSLVGQAENLRPTMERTREAIFNSLAHAPWAQKLDGTACLIGAHVLDLCCGTGAYGIEALSRGAATVQFFDRDNVSVSSVKASLSQLDIDHAIATVSHSDLRNEELPLVGYKVDMVFLDPPYKEVGLIKDILMRLEEQGFIGGDTLCVVETSRKNAPGLAEWLSEKGEVHATKNYGVASVIYWSPHR